MAAAWHHIFVYLVGHPLAECIDIRVQYERGSLQVFVVAGKCKKLSDDIIHTDLRWCIGRCVIHLPSQSPERLFDWAFWGRLGHDLQRRRRWDDRLGISSKLVLLFLLESEELTCV